MTLSPTTIDRIRGTLAGLACGDALGAGYEFGPPLGPEVRVDMIGGGSFNWEPGEWTDDTQMATVILQAARAAHQQGVTLLDNLDAVTSQWTTWAQTAADVGAQTSSVLQSAATPTAADVRAAAQAHLARTGRAGGNGSLMRTAPVALAYLHNREQRAEAARVVSDLTHPDPEAGDACVLWCDAIARAIETGVADVRGGVDLIPTGRRQAWLGYIDDAEMGTPEAFHHNNGWVVSAFRGAWSALVRGSATADVVELAVRGGSDTDTVAAIAGALAGAVYGFEALPDRWVGLVHGWPGLNVTELADAGLALAEGK